MFHQRQQAPGTVGLKKPCLSPLAPLAANVLILSLLAGAVAAANAQSSDSGIEEIVIRGHKTNLVGEASSASEGYVSQEEIAIRPLLRTGEVLETVPGLVATQHSGPGKANQYFLRGFNLDHGTDFATLVEGMPVNMRTHAHGQGYTDLNFIIPELIGEIVYRKGTYYPDVGDFSGTGSANMTVLPHLDGHRIKVASDTGQESWQRYLATGQFDTGENSHLIYGAEYETTDGHWDDIDTDLQRKNIWLQQHWEDGDDQFHMTLMAYDNSWNSADQIPLRAVNQGLITEFGSIDPTTGGESSRYSLSGQWLRQTTTGEIEASLYAIDYQMTLFSSFTYYMDNPDPTLGDQFNQFDDRRIYGGHYTWTTESKLGDLPVKHSLGTQFRYDDIDKVALYRTVARQRFSTVREDTVDEKSLGIFYEGEAQWTDKFRTVLGLRYDHYNFDVTPLAAENIASVALNGGSATDGIATTSLGLIYEINDAWESYFSIGQGFHSNDARGVVIKADPVTGDPVDAADPLVDTFGYEFGLRTFYDGKINASIALWSLAIDSELIFVGDSGSTEDTGVGSQRRGLEATVYYYPNDIFTFDVEYSYADAQLDEVIDGSTDIAGALEHVFSAGVNARWTDKFFTNLRLRYFGEYPLDGGFRADDSLIANLRLAYDVTDNLNLSVDILNLTDSKDRDIQYVYESQLLGEPAPVEDVHFHIFEPRTYHFTLSYQF